MTILLGRTIYDHLHRSRPGRIFNVFERRHLQVFPERGFASDRTSFASSRMAMSDSLPAICILTQSGKASHSPRQEVTAVKLWRNAQRVSSEAWAKEDTLRRVPPKTQKGPRLSGLRSQSCFGGVG